MSSCAIIGRSANQFPLNGENEHPRAHSAEREVHFKGGTKDLKMIFVNFELCGLRKKLSHFLPQVGREGSM